MKTKLPLIIAVAATLSAPAVSAQEERPPLPPPVPEAPRPPAPPEAAPERGRERRPEGERPPGRPDGERRLGGDRERGRPEGDRGPDLERGPARPDGERGPGRPDGERRPDGPRRPDGDRSISPRGESNTRDGAGRERGAERPSKPTPYIGVMTAPVPLPLATQLGLPEGFGVVVEEVVPESPAATAGMQRFDVLRMLDDQKLVGPDQLAVLVRSYGKDKEVTFTLLRKGEEQKLTLKIGERMLPERRASNLPSLGDLQRRFGNPWEQGPEQTRKLQEMMRGFQERMRDYQERFEQWRKSPQSATPPEPPKFENLGAPQPPHPPEPPQPRDLLREVRPGGRPQVRVDGDSTVTTWNTGEARVVVKDADGEVAVRSEDGRRTVEVKDASGATTFNGPIDTEDQRKALPEPVRKKLEKIHVRGQGGAPPRAADGEVREEARRSTPPEGPDRREVQ